MDKISGIIPQTPRTASKRFIDNTPVRPGAPSFGQPEGSVEIRDRVSITNAQPLDLKTYRNPKEAANVKIADSLTRKFFLMPEKEKSDTEQFSSPEIKSNKNPILSDLSDEQLPESVPDFHE